MWRVTLSKAARVQSLKGLAPSFQVAGDRGETNTCCSAMKLKEADHVS